MGRFFANQKLDEAGIVGITLQKLLIFFMVLDAASFFFGLSFFSSFMSLLFHFVVFMGVYRRRTAVLLLYVIFHVAVFILAAFLLILFVSSVMYVQPGYDSGSNEGIPQNYPTNDTIYDMRALRSYFDFIPTNTTVKHPTNYQSSGSVSSESTSYEYSSDEGYSQSFFLLSVIVLLVSVILLYCKILSVVLAYKMRKLLLAPTVLPVSRPETEVQQNVAEPTYIPADFENNAPIFTQPGFAYQPMFQQPGQSPMMPPPFMYGQHPVFYSYGPVPTNNNEKVEKL